MNLSLKNNFNTSLLNQHDEIRRCRPLLGTFVEISAQGADTKKTQVAIATAFGAIERIHKLMSFHDEYSEVTQLNRFAFNEPVLVSRETHQVLQAAKELYEATDGLFDIAIAPELIQRGLLPAHSFLNILKNDTGRTQDIVLQPDGRVRFLKPLSIDLGGIAKGFAVDQAMECLKENGVENAIVNAGGDIRCCGKKEHPIWVRHPRKEGVFFSLPALSNAALATSANAFEENENNIPHIHGQTRRPLAQPFSVSVRASTCSLADSLTKVVLALGEDSEALLKKFNATAVIIHSNDTMTYCGG